MLIQIRALALLPAVLAGFSMRAQVNPDVCKQVREDDVATLVTLNQSTVTTGDAPTVGACTWKVSTAFATGAEAYEVKLTVKQFDSHEEAVAEMKGRAPLLFDAKRSLVKTAGPDDHVASALNPNPVAADAQAVHGEYMSNVEVYPIESSARAHPTFEYRLQRLALQAVGATVLPTVGLPPDPVRPKAVVATNVQPAQVRPGEKLFVGIFVTALLAVAISIGLVLRRVIQPKA